MREIRIPIPEAWAKLLSYTEEECGKLQIAGTARSPNDEQVYGDTGIDVRHLDTEELWNDGIGVRIRRFNPGSYEICTVVCEVHLGEVKSLPHRKEVLWHEEGIRLNDHETP